MFDQVDCVFRFPQDLLDKLVKDGHVTTDESLDMFFRLQIRGAVHLTNKSQVSLFACSWKDLSEIGDIFMNEVPHIKKPPHTHNSTHAQTAPTLHRLLHGFMFGSFAGSVWVHGLLR